MISRQPIHAGTISVGDVVTETSIDLMMGVLAVLVGLHHAATKRAHRQPMPNLFHSLLPIKILLFYRLLFGLSC
jgi:hypothetical protein